MKLFWYTLLLFAINILAGNTDRHNSKYSRIPVFKIATTKKQRVFFHSGAITRNHSHLVVPAILKHVSGRLVIIQKSHDTIIILSSKGIFRNCRDIKKYFPKAPSGVYTIDPFPTGDHPPVNCQCDMETDGGGWTLVLNYLHKGFTEPLLNIRSVDFPLLSKNNLGTDESKTTYWGHASNKLLRQFNFSEVRFFGQTSGHS